jgi:hypothetical protein
LINLPGQETGEFEKVDLYEVANGRYEAGYPFSQFGIYEVTTYVQDSDGLLDYDQTRYIKMGEDPFEEDAPPLQPTPLLVNDMPNQIHSFHTPGDEDWLIFYGLGYEKKPFYELHIIRDRFSWTDPDCDLLISIHDFEGDLVLDPDSRSIQFEYKVFDYALPLKFSLPQTGFYLIRLTYGCDQFIPNASTYYKVVKLSDGSAGPTGNVSGFVLHGVYPWWPLDAWVFAIQEGSGEIFKTQCKGSEGYGFNLVEGDYRLHAEAEGYQNSDEILVRVVGESLVEQNLFLSPQDPNVWVYLHPGMNLFSLPCEIFSYDGKSFIQDVFQKVNTFYQVGGLSLDFRMSVHRYHHQNKQWQICLMDQNQSLDEAQDFSLYPYEAYVVFIDMKGADPNLKMVRFPFLCEEKDPNDIAYALERGFNLIGFSKLPTGYDPSRLFGDPDLKNKLEAILHYDPQKGSFGANYRMFGKPAGRSFPFAVDRGYIFFMIEGIHEWTPR